ncbi:MAG: PAS domain-containing sensor histidine kinase [Pedobacter sp.]
MKQDIIQVQDIGFYRDRLFKLLLYCLVPTGLIALVPGLFMAIKAGTTTGYLVAGVDTLIASALFYVIWSKRIKIHVKKIAITGSLYALAIFLMISLGSFGPGIIYILLLTVLMSLLFSSKTAQLSIWFNLIVCVILGIIVEFKLFDSILIKQYHLADWLAYSSNVMLFSVITFLLINHLIKSLEGRIKELSVSESRQLGLLASQTNYVIRTDMSGKYTYANDKFIRDFGWVNDDESIIGHDALGSILDYHHQRLFEMVDRCVAHPNEVFQVSLDKQKQDGGVMTTLWDIICMTDELDAPSEIQCIGIDISKRIQAERKLELSLKDLYTHNKELQTYAYVISHNLRAPIANVLGLVSLIEVDRDDAGAMNEYIRDLKESAFKLDQVVKDLSKGVSIAGHTIGLKEEVNLVEIFNAIKEDLNCLIKTTNTKLVLPTQSIYLRSSKAYLHIIFNNLLHNAIQHHAEDQQPKVTVTISEDAQHVTVAVTDNGIGIDVEKQFDDLFEPYKRLNTTQPGKGLGLFFVKRHTDALGGTIQVESKPGSGSTFKVVLPKQ